MKEGYYWFREAPGTQLHMLYVAEQISGCRQRVKDMTGRLPRIRGPRYVDDFKGIWWRVEEPGEAKGLCQCRQCLRDRDERNPSMPEFPAETGIFIVCEWCGNKRCPHATDHRLECRRSNEPGQAGSVYE